MTIRGECFLVWVASIGRLKQKLLFSDSIGTWTLAVDRWRSRLVCGEKSIKGLLFHVIKYKYTLHYILSLFIRYLDIISHLKNSFRKKQHIVILLVFFIFFFLFI